MNEMPTLEVQGLGCQGEISERDQQPSQLDIEGRIRSLLAEGTARPIGPASVRAHATDSSSHLESRLIQEEDFLATTTPQPRYSKEEFARRGDELYERDILPHMRSEDKGKFVVIDIETGAYEVDTDELAASDRMLARNPDAQLWLRRIGFAHARRFGSHRPQDPLHWTRCIE